MPKMTGINVLHKLKAYYADCRLKHARITIIEPEYVFITAFKTMNFARYLKSQGVNQCFDKPMSLSQLQDCLLNIII
jgi:CheY-like chemotaxis protein